jgi:hypothetical protein
VLVWAYSSMGLANHYFIEKRITITLMLDITPRTR